MPTVTKRLQQNRPQLKIETLDQNSEMMSERDLKSPNLVIQPMANSGEVNQDLLTPLTLGGGIKQQQSMMSSG